MNLVQQKTVYRKFKRFCDEISVSSGQIQHVRERFDRMLTRLKKDFSTEDFEVKGDFVGSYGRNTAIELSDVDVIVVLPYEVYAQYNAHVNNGQSKLLQSVRSSLQTTLFRSYIHADGQVVQINFSDGIRFEVVPAFAQRDGSFKTVDTHFGGSWKSTNPRAEQEAIYAMDRAHNYKCRRLARMIRVWRDAHHIPMSGWEIDTLVHRFWSRYEGENLSYECYGRMVCAFFDFLKDVNDRQSYYIAPGSGQHVPIKGHFRRQANCAYVCAEKAYNYEERGWTHLADDEWRNIFGNRFPNSY